VGPSFSRQAASEGGARPCFTRARLTANRAALSFERASFPHGDGLLRREPARDSRSGTRHSLGGARHSRAQAGVEQTLPLPAGLCRAGHDVGHPITRRLDDLQDGRRVAHARRAVRSPARLGTTARF